MTPPAKQMVSEVLFCAEYCDERVCLSVCPLAYRIRNTRPNFTKFSMLAARGRGSASLWRRCDMSCTSGCEDDVMFPTFGPMAQTTQV